MSIPARGASIAENRNGIAERALAVGAKWVLYLDDDQVLAPDTLVRLLAHDKDVISGLYVSREPPFKPHIYDHEDELGFCRFRPLAPFEGGLHNVLATGAGCMLIKTDVLRKLEQPWWRLGQITMDGWGDDLNFCHRIREAGFEIWCDFDVVVGHQMNATLWPKRKEDGEWYTVIVQKEPLVEFPAARLDSPILTIA